MGREGLFSESELEDICRLPELITARVMAVQAA